MKLLAMLILFFAFFSSNCAIGGPAVIYNGDFVKALKSNLKLKDEARVITGSSDPTSVAVDAEAGSLYIRSNGSVYIKKDAGSSTNWEEIPGLPITLTTDVTGVLPVANGGTNASTALSGNRLIYSSGGGLVEYSGITANRALATDGTGLPVASATTDTELGYLSGTTSSVQTQLNGKLENVVEDLSPQLGANLSLNDGSSTYSITDGSEIVFRVNSGTNSVAVGQNAGAGTIGDGVAGLGHESCSNAGSNSTCMGNESGPETSGDANFVAIGQLSKADDNSVSIGNFTQADGERATAVGRSATAQANDSISLGAFATNTSQPNRLQIGAPSGSFAAITQAQMGNVSASFGLAPNATSDAVESGTLTVKASDKTNAGATGDAGDLILLPGKNSGSGADGEVIIDGLNWPTADGSSGQFLQTNGSAQLSFASLPAATSTTAGVVVALKQYDNTTVTVTPSTAATLSRAVFVPYQTVDGAWRMRFNLDYTLTVATTANTNFAITGVTFKTGYSQAVALAEGSTNVEFHGFTASGANTVSVINENSALTYNRVMASGDVELDGKPSWAD